MMAGRRWRKSGILPFRAGSNPAGYGDDAKIGESVAAVRTSRTLASAAMPSPRPAKPRCSVVVALTLTCSIRARQSAAMFATICATCGASLGACAITVALRPRSAGRVRMPQTQAAARGCPRPCHGVPYRVRDADVARRQRTKNRVADRVQQLTSASEWPARPRLGEWSRHSTGRAPTTKAHGRNQADAHLRPRHSRSPLPGSLPRAQRPPDRSP